MIVESEDSWEVRSDRLLLHEVIGEGAFGVVRRATLAPAGTNVAVKMLKGEGLPATLGYTIAKINILI